MVLAGCGVLLGILVITTGGIFGMAAQQAAAEQGANAKEASAVAGLFGVSFALVGGILVVHAALSIAVGWGMFKSAKWAFILGAVLYGIGLALNLIGFSILGILISGALFTYCLLRLTGNLGPRPA